MISLCPSSSFFFRFTLYITIFINLGSFPLGFKILEEHWSQGLKNPTKLVQLRNYNFTLLISILHLSFQFCERKNQKQDDLLSSGSIVFNVKGAVVSQPSFHGSFWSLRLQSRTSSEHLLSENVPVGSKNLNHFIRSCLKFTHLKKCEQVLYVNFVIHWIVFQCSNSETKVRFWNWH